MKKTFGRFVIGVLAFTVTAGAMAQLTVEEQIKFRQSAYVFAAWNMGKIKAQVVDGDVPYNREQVEAAARAIAGVANSGMGALYGPGTGEGSGWKTTRLDPKFFDEADKVREIAIRFNTEANRLVEVAATGDQAAIAAQFAAVGDSCKACHDDYRLPE